MRISKWEGKLLAGTAIIALFSAILPVLCGSSQAKTDNAVGISVAVTGMKPAIIQQVTGNEAVINVGEFPQGGSPGDPLLPYKSVTLVVPPNANLEKLSAGLISEKWEELPGQYDIAPVKPAAASRDNKTIVSWGNKDKSRIVNGKDISIYGKDAYFPAVPVQIVSVGKFRQFKLVELRVWLAAYNPVQKKVRVLTNAQVSLSVEKLPPGRAVGLDSAVLPKFPKTKKFESQLQPNIANPQDIETFFGQTSAPAAQSGGTAPLTVPADYVIITTSSIASNSTTLENFIAAKQAAGFNIKTVAEGDQETDLTYISGATCEQRADNIRTWLQNHCIDDGIEYALLIGDPDPCIFTDNMSVPMKMCWPRKHTGDDINDIKCPTDMYFAELSGNWDIDANGYYGEFYHDYGPGGADKYCELRIGRIPVYDINCVDLDAILQKCIDYNNATGDLSWRSKVLIPAAISNFGPQDNNGDGDAGDPVDYPDESWRTFGDDWGNDIKALARLRSIKPYTLYEKIGIYGNGSAYPLTACSTPLDNANFINEWKNKYGFVTWWAHGAPESTARFTWKSDNIFVGITGNGPSNSQHHGETTFTDFITNTDCALLDDNAPSFVIQVSCDNGWPEKTSNLGYCLLRHGAIGTISGTRTTWYSFGSWNVSKGSSWGDNASYGYYCFNRMAYSAEDIGTALVWCRSNFGTGWTDGGSWMNMIGFNIYGDPSLSLDLPPSEIKWAQPPDTSTNGMDIRCDRRKELADDFLCTTTGPINKITLWSSWLGDHKSAISTIVLTIFDDNPVGTGGFSEPNTVLWGKAFYPGDFNDTLYDDNNITEWFWDPSINNATYPGDHQIWQYDFNIPSGGFVQQGDPSHPIVYWLGVRVLLDPPIDPNEFGWKTSFLHWNDDAVWRSASGPWNELRYPVGHLFYEQSVDLAFCIYGSKQIPVCYVDINAPGANNGTSWTDAYHYLQDALADPNAHLIWVAEGTYYPDTNSAEPNGSGDRIKSFVLKNGVAIYGGFAGFGAPDPNARDVKLYETILSGDLAGNDVYVADPCNLPTDPCRAENSYHVVCGGNTNRTAILDGFTITAGNANFGAWPNDNGGGMFNDNGANCILNNCTFVENSSGGGGGIFNGSSNLLIKNCAFYRNAGTNGGGGIENYVSSPTIANCIFISNKGADATSNGGGVYNIKDCNLMMINCMFSSNSAEWGGGVANIHASNPTITNCTFTGNVAVGGGCGAIDDYNNCNPVITNCIFWGSTAPQICDIAGSAATVNYSDVQGGWGGAGVGNIDSDPRFVDANGQDGIIGTLDDNLRLSSNSPCIDIGSDTHVPPDVADIDGDSKTTEKTSLDLDNRPRFADGDCDGNTIVDMGAYEFNYAYAGDFDSDCDVDFSDFAILGNSWLQNNPSVDIAPPPEGDSIIDIKDLVVLCDNWLAGK
jgi:hypothetical protein